VRGYPTILFIDAGGQVEGKIPGYEAAGPFSHTMRKLVMAHRYTSEAQPKYERDHKDVEAICKLSAASSWRDDPDRAKELIVEAKAADPKNANGYLAIAYNALGDYYRERGPNETATLAFQKAVQAGKQPADLAYAHVSLALLYESQEQYKEALSELDKTVAVPDCPKNFKDQAEELRAKIEKAQNSK
jgi:tetratricopeptide (TPR) repeat protein